MGMKGKIALGAVVGVVVIGVVSANAGSDSGSGDKGKDTSASADRESGKKADTKTGGKADKAEKKVAFKGDGDFQVGTDIKPGTYRTTGNTDDMCYWERAKDASGEVDSLLANDNVSGTSYVTIKASDKLFKSSGCKDWEAVDAKASGSPASQIKGNGGMYRVGADIAPGTYKSTGNTDDSCYWERDKDATHSMDSIVANNNVTGTAVVTISAGDGYFKTTGCGDWKKTG
ncbi:MULTISPECIES: hypothetical protein [unclassified Streptomyces]|uniref:hypothetical protein n=1 Tax=unclassified Streptomyces TaxID=2593676 RepID=UPI002E803616|nr:hypothetical protein [Streptomyces sp. NBC_00589]WTI38665.1 hypothetical protein OIC96_28600 [Streptomyces sp. NBC_00775]WUB27656.1 hypothetical protein OHA51_21135 [Streptomyces sp. NBC_00589]